MAAASCGASFPPEGTRPRQATVHATPSRCLREGRRSREYRGSSGRTLMCVCLHFAIVSALYPAHAPVVVVGAGVAGLNCAQQLTAAGIDTLVLEASDDVGGRVRTDIHEGGYLLDHGFQVFLDAYPEAQKVLDYDALDLYRFTPGAILQNGENRCMVMDPLRGPPRALLTLAAPFGTAADKLKLASFAVRLLSGVFPESPEVTTEVFLREQLRLSPMIINDFFRPFLFGIFLAPLSEQSSKLFCFVFRKFLLGHACLPAKGMGAVPRQMAASIPSTSLFLSSRVVQLQKRPSSSGWEVLLAESETISCDHVVVAADGPEACRLLNIDIPPARSSICMYFGFQGPAPVSEPLLILNSQTLIDGRTVNNVCFPSVVCPSYAPPGHNLASVSLIGDLISDEAELVNHVRAQLTTWFGEEAAKWRFLKSYVCRYAQPAQSPPNDDQFMRNVQLEPGLYVCGDHRATPSLNGALGSGALAAQAVRKQLAHQDR